MGACGGCTLCCEVLLIQSLGKPASSLCPHAARGVGCEIRDSRPEACRRFFCLWVTNPAFPPELRPDRCGVLFEPGGDRVFLANVDPGRPRSWMEGIARAFMEKCMRDGYAVIVQVGAVKHVLVPLGQTARDVWSRARNDAVRRGYL